MIIKCFRCGVNIDTPDNFNSDYVIANDTIVKELREVLIALKHNQATLAKKAKMLVINESEYDAIETPDIKTARQSYGKDLVKVVVETKEKDIQKTGIMCPDCFNEATDEVIWGIHK